MFIFYFHFAPLVSFRNCTVILDRNSIMALWLEPFNLTEEGRERLLEAGHRTSAETTVKLAP